MLHNTRLRWLAAAAALLLAACGQSEPSTDAPSASDLPSLSELVTGGLSHQASATQFELLDSAPLAMSASGVTTSGGEVTLDSTGGGAVWAIYALQGFPTDGSIVPVSVSIAQLAPCWVAIGDFGSNRWEIVRSDATGVITPEATELVSPAGAFYVALLGFESWTKVTSLVVNTSADLAVPTPNLTTISATGELAAGIPSFFSAEGSDPGAGAGYNASDPITYDWNDGSPVDVATDPLAEVSHTWPTAGPKTVTVTVLNDQGTSLSRDFDVLLGEPFREMLVVYNSDIPESVDLKTYYCSSRNGRLIDPEYVLELPLGTNANVWLSRAEYESDIRNPIRAHLDSSGYKDALKYILLLKGVPHKISTGDGSTNASVDSELCLLYSDGSYPYDNWLYSAPATQDVGTTGFYGQASASFQPSTFVVSYDPTYLDPDSGDETEYVLDYLVGRLGAYTYDEAKLLVDRSTGADKSGTGWVVIDSSSELFSGNPQHVYDTMVDWVFKYPDSSGPAENSLEELLIAADHNHFADVTSERILNGSLSLPPAFDNRVIGYTGWGVNHAGGSWPSGNQYILNDLQWSYLPGACWMSYESYNGWNFNGDDLADRNGQGQICDFFRMGGTCAIGNAWEPYTIGVGDERVVFNRYIIHGDRWIEAAYKGLRLLSWMEVVVGDPLCTVK